VEVVQQPSGRSGWAAAADYDGTAWLASVHDGLIAVTSGADVALTDPLTGERSPITEGMSVADLAFSPEGMRVAILDMVHGPLVITTSMTSPAPTPEPGGEVYGPPVIRDPAFAPDGEAVAYLAGQDGVAPNLLWLGTGEAPRLPDIMTLFPVTWSPDGQWLVTAKDFDSTPNNDNWEIVLLEVGGSGITRLTNHLGFDGGPAWSPDGSTIAFLQDADDGSLTMALMDADGAHQRRLLLFPPSKTPFGVGRTAWSPDGSRLSIVLERDGSPAEIHLIDARTSEQVTFAGPDDRCEDLTWSPTGRQIAFVCGPADNSSPSSVYVVAMDGDGAVDLGYGTRIDWGRTLETYATGG
jgi:dipeptidyl aminopeptidase/acylaminoacyl peptidase